MSTPATPERSRSPSQGDADPLRTVKADGARQQQQPQDDEEASGSRPTSPFSFKRKASNGQGAASPTAASARRSVSNFFSRRPSARANSGPPSNTLTLPQPSSFGGAAPSQSNAPSGLRSPSAASLATPPTRRVSGAIRGAAARKVSRGGLRSSGPLSPGAHQKRIHDWQNTASYGSPRSPANEMPGGGGGDDDDDDDEEDPDAEQYRLDNEPILPKMLPELRTPQHETPLPKLPIVVLAICMIGEFLSASVGGPFLFFMLEDLGVPGGGGESAVGFWAGIVSASFFLTQFATALLWASAAARYGRRAVLFTSLLGNTIMLLLYGTSKSVILMVVIRLFQGVFNGAVGVARSAVKDITDNTNEGRAYSIVGLAWSLGGIVGPAIGGWTEHPVENLPKLFGDSQLYSKYPYLLPCSLAATVTGTGCILSLFLSYDAGQPDGGIRLPEERDVERAVHKVASFSGSVKKKVSGYFGQADLTATRQAHEITSPGPSILTGPAARPMSMGGTGTVKPRASFAIPHRGSAYGYDVRRKDTALSRFRKMSTATSTRYAPDYEEFEYEPAPLNFAQKLLLANDEAGMFNITDLWVAAATREDGLPYTSANLEEDVFAEDEDESMAIGNVTQTTTEERDPFSDETSILGINPSIGRLRQDSIAASATTTGRQGSPLRPGGRMSSARYRANSTVSNASRPAIYQNTGLARSPATSPVRRRESLDLPYLDQPPTPGVNGGPSGLAAIPEGKAASDNGLLAVPTDDGSDSATIVRGGDSTSNRQELSEKDPLQDFSIMRDLPIKLIAQYAVLALHGTIMDQIFMSFLVSKTAAGGLGLEASDYADIIACMCFFQMLFQFRFYPTVSMPIGRLNHLQMFRLGLMLYLIPYLFFPELRPLLGPGGERNKTVTFGLILLTATRYLANTCSYTAVMILTNAMTPPAYIPMANGLAQSVVSLARFIGPLTGGILWSRSISDGPEGYYMGFMVVAVICVLGFAHSFTIR